MNALRRDLEAQGCRLPCQGARMDVYPPSTSRDRSAERKAFVLHPGATACGDALVDIVDPARPDQVGTADEQLAFYNRWYDAGMPLIRAARK